MICWKSNLQEDKSGKKLPPVDGFEPSTFRLTGERANRLPHRDKHSNGIQMLQKMFSDYLVENI